ncbi:hypothetical protein [Paraburkholderia aromaticivorans]|uniref:hypothetical protein n=1 Tax=Paraburkholderia aromaticivorans TaxID=2026199 RepID=UPI001455E4F1|nr:hypothetical protein [Paraburkholderia aromaticivorans]
MLPLLLFVAAFVAVIVLTIQLKDPGPSWSRRHSEGTKQCTGAMLRMGGYYPIEMLPALSIGSLSGGLRSDDIVRLRDGCVRKEPFIGQQATQCSMLDVPVRMTGMAFIKPTNAIVMEGIAKSPVRKGRSAKRKMFQQTSGQAGLTNAS